MMSSDYKGAFVSTFSVAAVDQFPFSSPQSTSGAAASQGLASTFYVVVALNVLGEGRNLI